MTVERTKQLSKNLKRPFYQDATLIPTLNFKADTFVVDYLIFESH